jgi:putative addiction module component (TIGR02574 family)
MHGRSRVNTTEMLTEIAALSLEDRLRLVDDIWETIIADTADLEASPAERKLIEDRLAAYLARPDDAVAWEDVKAEALARIRR